MRTRIVVYAALFSLGSGLAAAAAPLARNLSAAEEEMPSAPARNPTAPAQKPLAAPVPPRGQMLYENHCTACHESVVHIREDRRARSAAELQRRVSQWASHLRLRWSVDDVEEVAAYLDTRYYKFELR